MKPDDEVDLPARAVRAGERRIAELEAALRELHRAVTEDDLSDADHARLGDAVAEAQRLAPHVPQPPSEGF